MYLKLQRSFNEIKGNLFTDIFIDLSIDPITIHFPIINSKIFNNLIKKIFPTKKNIKFQEKKIEVKTKKQKKMNKNYYSVTVSRKTSSYGSIDMRNDDEFHDAYEDLEEIIYNEKEKFKIFPDDFAIERKKKLKANKITNYFKKNEISLIQLKNYISIKANIDISKINIEVIKKIKIIIFLFY